MNMRLKPRRASFRSEPRPGDVNLRQTEWLIDAVIDPEVCRVELPVRREGDEYAVEAKAGFVDQSGAECVRLVESKDLAARLAGVAESRNRVALQGRLASQVALDGVVAVQTVIRSQRMAHVACPLVEVNRRRGRTN